MTKFFITAAVISLGAAASLPLLRKPRMGLHGPGCQHTAAGRVAAASAAGRPVMPDNTKLLVAGRQPNHPRAIANRPPRPFGIRTIRRCPTSSPTGGKAATPSLPADCATINGKSRPENANVTGLSYE